MRHMRALRSSALRTVDSLTGDILYSTSTSSSGQPESLPRPSLGNDNTCGGPAVSSLSGEESSISPPLVGSLTPSSSSHPMEDDEDARSLAMEDGEDARYLVTTEQFCPTRVPAQVSVSFFVFEHGHGMPRGSTSCFFIFV